MSSVSTEALTRSKLVPLNKIKLLATVVQVLQEDSLWGNQLNLLISSDFVV